MRIHQFWGAHIWHFCWSTKFCFWIFKVASDAFLNGITKGLDSWSEQVKLALLDKIKVHSFWHWWFWTLFSDFWPLTTELNSAALKQKAIEIQVFKQVFPWDDLGQGDSLVTLTAIWTSPLLRRLSSSSTLLYKATLLGPNSVLTDCFYCHVLRNNEPVDQFEIQNQKRMLSESRQKS